MISTNPPREGGWVARLGRERGHEGKKRGETQSQANAGTLERASALHALSVRPLDMQRVPGERMEVRRVNERPCPPSAAP